MYKWERRAEEQSVFMALCFLTMALLWPAPPSSEPTMMRCTLDLWARMNPFCSVIFVGAFYHSNRKRNKSLAGGHFTFFHGFWVGASTFKDSLPLLQFVSMTFEENAFPVLCEPKLLETSCVCRTWWTDQNAALWKDWNVDPLPFPHLKARSLTLSWASSIPLEQPFPVHLNLNLN